MSSCSFLKKPSSMAVVRVSCPCAIIDGLCIDSQGEKRRSKVSRRSTENGSLTHGFLTNLSNSQSRHGVDPRRPSRGKIGGQQGHCRQPHSRKRGHHRVRGPHFE